MLSYIWENGGDIATKEGYAWVGELDSAESIAGLEFFKELFDTANSAPADGDDANDYIAKPFKFDELLARVRSRLRENVATATIAVSHLDVSLDVLTRRATVSGREVDLSAREFALAEQFLRHPGQVLSREQLLSNVWGYDFEPGSNVVDVYVRYLRRKLGTDRFETVRGMGYRLV